MYATLGAQRVYRAALDGLTQRDARDAAQSASWLARYVDDALQARARGDVDEHATSQLYRAAVIEHFRVTFARDGQETAKAVAVLQEIEAATGTRFPLQPLREQFVETPLAIWDMETNRYLCKTCATWTSGDGHHPLAPVPCSGCSEPVVP